MAKILINAMSVQQLRCGHLYEKYEILKYNFIDIFT